MQKPEMDILVDSQNSHHLFFAILDQELTRTFVLSEEQEDGARDGDGEGSEGDKHEENSDDNSKSSEASKDFEFVQKE